MTDMSMGHEKFATPRPLQGEVKVVSVSFPAPAAVVVSATGGPGSGAIRAARVAAVQHRRAFEELAKQ